MRFLVAVWACGALAAVTGAAGGAERGERDTAVVQLPEVQITALRGHDRPREIPAASFAFTRERIRQSGATRLASLLATLPGLYGYQQSSSGDPSVVDPRGFTANGERSYLKVLVNGQDVRDVENGAVDWDWLPPGSVERLEVVQGPGAWAYGDGSEGGIVNIVRGQPAPGLHAEGMGQAGSFGLRTGGVVVSGRRDRMEASYRYSIRRVDGWRDHSQERAVSTGGEAGWEVSDRLHVGVDAAWLDATRDDPGTLPPSLADEEPTRTETRSDMSRAKRLMLGGHLRMQRLLGAEWTASPYFRTEDVIQIRTLFTGTPLEQARWHPSRSWTGGIEVGWQRPLTFAGREVELSAGSQVERAKLRSRYYDYAAGTRGAFRERTDSWRTVGSLWTHAKLPLDDRTVARVGLRYDATRMRSEDPIRIIIVPNHTRFAWSPIVALNRSLSEGLNAWASYSSAFRVPSLSQLFDHRPIDFGPQTFYLSSYELVPQRAHSGELGGRWEGPDGALALLTVYSTWVRNEIDFDATTFRYANLDRSWHRGVQAVFETPLPRRLMARAHGTWSPTTLRGGPNDGNQINAVPTGMLYGSLGWNPIPGWQVEAAARWVGRQYLDKANQHPLASFATVELGVSARLEHARVSLRVANLLNRRYADTGYLLDLQPIVIEERLSPAAPRSVTLGISLD